MEEHTSTPFTLEPGYWVALTIREGVTPLRSYVGQVEAVDAHGIRLTLVDWIIGTASGYDLFVSWANIEAALVATPKHDVERFGARAEKWQSAMSGTST